MTLQAALAAPLPHSDPSSVKPCPPCAHTQPPHRTADTRHHGGATTLSNLRCNVFYREVLWRKGSVGRWSAVRNNQGVLRGEGQGHAMMAVQCCFKETATAAKMQPNIDPISLFMVYVLQLIWIISNYRY